MLQENVLISFLKKFDDYPFLVKMNGNEYRIGEGEWHDAAGYRLRMGLSAN